jgi:hypothetical protein
MTRRLEVQRRWRRLVLLATIGVSVGGTSGSASAFCRTRTCGDKCTFDEKTCPVEGVPVAWSASCLSYSVHRDGSPSISHAELTKATEVAFRAWQEATCAPTHAPPTISVSHLFGTATCGRVEYNPRQANANIIVIRETWDEERRSELALTTVSYGTKTGQIYDVDIEINGSQPITAGPIEPNRFDLQSVMTHEAGHFFGIAHSDKGLADDCRDGATMCPVYAPGGDDLRTLDEDDVAAICAAYPPDRQIPACDPRPHMGFSPECGFDPMTGGGCTLALRPVRWSASATIAIALAWSVGVGRLRGARQRAQKRR